MTPSDRLLIAVVIVAAAWLMLGLMVATYGANRGFAFWPLLACSLFLSPLIVLLAVTIGSALREAFLTRAEEGP